MRNLPLFSRFKRWGCGPAALVVGLCSWVLPAEAQRGHTTEAGPLTEKRQFLVFRGGYTAGRFGHSTEDYQPKLYLFGGSNSRTGQPVEHRFSGALLGADIEQEFYHPESKRTTTVAIGLDLLAASDRLTIGNSRKVQLTLGAIHPHFELGLTTRNWQFRGGGGLLLGRVGYYGSTTDGFLAGATVVDTATVVPTFQTRIGWRNWVIGESGYGANGLLGLANPVWQAGFGTGFGRRSPVVIILGVSMPESIDFENQQGGYGYLRLEAAPAASRWRANGLLTFGTESYNRVALQVAYRLAQRAGSPATNF